MKFCCASVPIWLPACDHQRIQTAGGCGGRAGDGGRVPSPLSVRLMPDGSVPAEVIVATGKPDVVIVNVPAIPAVNVVSAALVIEGVSSTVRSKRLRRRRTDAVVRGDGQGIAAAGGGRGRSGQSCGAVAVGHQRDARGQRAGPGDRPRRGSRCSSP